MAVPGQWPGPWSSVPRVTPSNMSRSSPSLGTLMRPISLVFSVPSAAIGCGWGRTIGAAVVEGAMAAGVVGASVVGASVGGAAVGEGGGGGGPLGGGRRRGGCRRRRGGGDLARGPGGGGLGGQRRGHGRGRHGRGAVVLGAAPAARAEDDDSGRDRRAPPCSSHGHS